MKINHAHENENEQNSISFFDFSPAAFPFNTKIIWNLPLRIILHWLHVCRWRNGDAIRTLSSNLREKNYKMNIIRTNNPLLNKMEECVEYIFTITWHSSVGSGSFMYFRRNGATSIGSNFSTLLGVKKLTTRPMLMVTIAPVTVYQR